MCTKRIFNFGKCNDAQEESLGGKSVTKVNVKIYKKKNLPLVNILMHTIILNKSLPLFSYFRVTAALNMLPRCSCWDAKKLLRAQLFFFLILL